MAISFPPTREVVFIVRWVVGNPAPKFHFWIFLLEFLAPTVVGYSPQGSESENRIIPVCLWEQHPWESERSRTETSKNLNLDTNTTEASVDPAGNTDVGMVFQDVLLPIMDASCSLGMGHCLKKAAPFWPSEILRMNCQTAVFPTAGGMSVSVCKGSSAQCTTPPTAIPDLLKFIA